MSTVRKHCDVDQVEKQLMKKNVTLSKLESRVRLFNRMIKYGVSTADVDSFTKKQADLRSVKLKPCDKTKKAAIKSKLNDAKAAITVTRRERRNLKRELEYLLRDKKQVMEAKLENMKAHKTEITKIEDLKNINKFKHLREKQKHIRSNGTSIPGLGGKGQLKDILKDIPSNISEIVKETTIFQSDLTPEPADGPMVCDSKISLSPEEIAFLKRGPRYMLRGNFSLRPGASRGQLKKFYPNYFKDILNLVCNFGFFGKALKLKMNII